MIEIKTIAQLRKLIKPIGYNVKTKMLDFGRFATFYKGDKKCPTIFFSKEELATWEPLFNLLDECTFNLDEKVYGLKRRK